MAGVDETPVLRQGLRGEVLKTSLSNEQEANLRKALSETEPEPPAA